LRYAPRHSRPPQHRAPRHARRRPASARRRSRKWVVIGMVAALPAVLALSAKAFSPTPAGSTDAQGGVGAMLGAYVRSTASNSRADQQAAFTAFERDAGRKLAIDHFYLPWGNGPSGLEARAAWDLANGRVPMVTFGTGGDTVQVARGDQDGYLASLAAAVRSLGKPVLLRYAPTPDTAGSASWVHSGSDYVAAWRHVRQVFAGVPAAWVWSPTADAFAGARGGVEQFWPGAEWVDWIAAEGFNRYACQGVQGSWRELGDIFRNFYGWGSAKGKPLMISGTGTSEDPADPRRKAQWLSNAARTLQTAMPNVKALVYAQSFGTCDWRTGTSDASLEAFDRLAADPWLQLPGSAMVGSSRPPVTTAPPTTRPAPTTTRPAPTTTATTAPPATAPPAPPGGSVSGKLVPGSGALWGSSGVTDSLEAQLGRRFDISHTYHDWDDAFPNAGEVARANKGTTLLINWTPRFFGSSRIMPWRDVANGSQDAQIDATAGRVKAFGRKLFLAFHTEPEPQVGKYGSAADFVAAWRHIHDRFAARGVGNVVWVWNVTGSSGWFSLYTGGLYPGDAYVDWIGWDPYNWYTCHNNGWMSFGDKVGPTYNWFRQNGFGDKPFMLAEYGTRDMPGNPGAKADWFRGIVPALKRLPNLKAVVYFNNGTANPGCDWRIDTTPQAQAAFSEVGRDGFVA
jgi:beta-mannanase